MAWCDLTYLQKVIVYQSSEEEDKTEEDEDKTEEEEEEEEEEPVKKKRKAPAKGTPKIQIRKKPSSKPASPVSETKCTSSMLSPFVDHWWSKNDLLP